MRVLVTGAAGVVGRAVRRALADEHDLVLLDRRPVPDVVSSVQVDIRDWRVLRQTLEAHKPLDAIIHLVYAPENLTLTSEEQILRQFDVSGSRYLGCSAGSASQWSLQMCVQLLDERVRILATWSLCR